MTNGKLQRNGSAEKDWAEAARTRMSPDGYRRRAVNGDLVLPARRAKRRPPKRKRRGRHPRNALTPAFVRNVSRAGRYCDGNRLYLDVRPTGSRGWVQRLVIRAAAPISDSVDSPLSR